MLALSRYCLTTMAILALLAGPVLGVPPGGADTTNLAVDAYQEGDYLCAARLLEGIARESPANVELYKYLGYAYTAAVFEKVPNQQDKVHPSFDPADVEAAKKALYAFLSYYQSGGSDPRLVHYVDILSCSPILEEESLKMLKRLTLQEPLDPNYWRWLAKLEDATSHTEDAFDAAKHWLQVEPESVDAYVQMGHLFLRLCLISKSPLSVVKGIIDDNIRKVGLYLADHPGDLTVLQLLSDLREARGWYLSNEVDRAQNRLAKYVLSAEMSQCSSNPAGAAEFQAFANGKAFHEYLPMEPPSYLILQGDPPKDARIKAMGSIRAPGILRRGIPPYPALEESSGEGGRVVMEVIIDPDGMVSAARILKGSSPPFDFAALDAAKRWVYQRPYYLGPEPRGSFVSVYWIITVNFAPAR